MGDRTPRYTSPLESALRMIAALLSGENPTSQTLNSLPPILPPLPAQLTTGLGPSADRATAWMPLDQKRVLQRLIAEKRLGLSPMPWQPGSYQKGEYRVTDDRININPEMLLYPEQEQAANLTHEATHALQPQGWFDRWLERPRARVPPAVSTGHAYLDNPREREARLAEQLVVKP